VTQPLVARTREELATALGGLGDTRTALVPTMGALHAGHRALLARAADLADRVVVSIFVNPLQFGPGEDLDRYPRPFAADLAVCAEHGVDLVWAPAVDEMYPSGPPSVRVSAGPLGDVLEGAHRPGHFDGVLTVVAKLLGQVRPQVALFGAKDAQQLVLVRRMVADLDIGVDVASVPTVRDPDGLAAASRNVYLDPQQRRSALALSRALAAGEAAAPQGARAVRAAARDVLAQQPDVVVDYLALVDPATLVEVADDATGSLLLLVAARVGTTRLIDNTTLTC